MKRSPLRRATPLRRSKKRLKIRIRKKDLEWARAVKERDGGLCVWCVDHAKWPWGQERVTKPRGLHAAHIFGRSKRSTRWELANGISLCFAHHMIAHSHPLKWIEFARRKLGDATFESLRRRALGIEEKATVTG